VRPRPPPPKSLIGLSLPARPRTCAGHKDAGPYRRGVRPSPRRPPARLLLLLRAAAIRELSPSLTVQFRSITIVVTSIALHAARLSTRSPLIGSGIELLGFDSARRIPEARTRVRRPAVSLFLSLSLSLSLSLKESQSADRRVFERLRASPANGRKDRARERERARARASEREREREREKGGGRGPLDRDAIYRKRAVPFPVKYGTRCKWRTARASVTHCASRNSLSLSLFLSLSIFFLSLQGGSSPAAVVAPPRSIEFPTPSQSSAFISPNLPAPRGTKTKRRDHLEQGDSLTDAGLSD